MADKVLDTLTLRDTKSGTATEYKIQDSVLKARVDALTKLGEGSTTGDAELQDIRVDYKGTTHENAGDAVRASDQALNDKIDDEVSKLKEDFVNYQNEISDNIPNIFDGIFDESGYINSDGTNSNSNPSFKRTSKFYPINIANGILLYFHASESTPNIGIIIYKSDKITVQKTQSLNNGTDSQTDFSEDGYFRIWTNNTFDGDLYVGQTPFNEYNEYSMHKVTMRSLSHEVTSVINKANKIVETVGKNIFDVDGSGVIQGKYIDTSGHEIASSAWNISHYIDVSDCESIIGSVYKSDGTYFTYCKLSLMHAYDKDKKHIGKIWDISTNTNGVYTVGSNVSFVRFCWEPNSETSNNRKIMVEKGSIHSDIYEPYKITTSLSDSEYVTKEDIKNITPSEIDSISCWGDSLTYSHNTTVTTSPNVGSVTYPSKLAELTGLPCANLGMPGANSNDISGLQGGMPIYLDPFTLPALSTNSSQVTLRDSNGDTDFIGLLHWMPRSGWINPLTNMGLTWEIDGIKVQLFYSSGVMKVGRIDDASSDTVFTRPVRIKPVHIYAKEQIQIFFVGTNDAPTTKEKAERTVGIVQNMVKFYGGKRYLVIGMTQKNYAEYTNPIFAQTFGNNYVDARNYMIRYGLSDSNITPTSQDTEDVANGLIPTSLRSDSIHFNDYGYTALANCVYYHGKTLGYWD